MGDISKRGRGVVRVRAQGVGPMSTARRDMTHGYYQPDMGMQGGQMYRGGGVVKKKGSIGVALKHGGRARKFGGGRTDLIVGETLLLLRSIPKPLLAIPNILIGPTY